MENRRATVERKTQETDIKVDINIDGSGTSKVQTGIGFFNHMLTGFAKHGFFDIDVTCMAQKTAARQERSGQH